MPGYAPQLGFELIEGRWVLGVAAGTNKSYQSGLTAHAGGTQAAGILIPSLVALVEFDTVANAGDSAILPFADVLGTEIVVMNNTSTSMNVFSNPGTNPVTGSADSLNGSTSSAKAVAGNTAVRFYCAKAGVWIAS